MLPCSLGLFSRCGFYHPEPLFALALYALTAAFYPFLEKRFDRGVTSTDMLAKAMLRLATTGNSKKTLTNAELNHLARNFSAPTALQAKGRAA